MAFEQSEIDDGFLIDPRQQQVDIVGHEYIRMQGTVRLLSISLQPTQIEPIVVIGVKTRLAVLPSLNQLKGHVR